MTWFAFWLWVGTSALGALLQKAPQSAKASSIDGGQFPTIEEGKKIKMVLGTCKVTESNVTWWGDVRTKAIKKKTGGFFGIGRKTYTVGHKYYLGLQMALGSGLIDALEDMVVDGKSLKAAGVSFPKVYAAGGTVFSVNLPDLFGGEESEGGISGDIAFYFGSRTQLGDSYLAGVLGKAMPGYRDVAHAVLRRFYIGTAPYLKTIEWVLRACPVPEGMSGANANIDGDCNPAHGIAHILTADPDNGGLGRPIARLDIASFNAAAAVFAAEGLGISILLDTGRPADDWIEDILGTVDAVLYEDPSTGLYTLNVIRNDYVLGDLVSLTPSDIQSFKRKTPNWIETLNRVVIEYTDRAAGFVKGTAQAVSLGNREIQGKAVSKVISYPALSKGTNAQRAADRELRSLSYPLIPATLVANRKAWKLRKGSAFKVTWPDDDLVDRVFRVNTIRYGSLEAGQITIDAIEDQFGAFEATSTPPPDSDWVNPLTPPVAAAQQALVEAPYWMVGESRNAIALGARGDTTTQGMEIWTNLGAGYLQSGLLEPTTPTGTLTSSWSAKTAALDAVGFTVGSGVDLDRLASTNADGRARGELLALVGSEWVSPTTVTDNGDGTFTLSGVLRGLLDSVPVDHAAGERVWFVGEGADLTQSEETGGSGTGPKGDPGTPGTVINWRGEWSATTSYDPQDGVTRNGSSYAALQPSTGLDPALYPAYWTMTAQAGVSAFTRATSSVTTPDPVAAGGTAAVETSVRSVADILRIATNYPAWVRVYSTAAARTADSGRLITDDPAPGAGCFADVATTADALVVNMSPVPVFWNGDDPVADTAYLAIKNLDSTARTIIVDLTYLPQEA